MPGAYTHLPRIPANSPENTNPKKPAEEASISYVRPPIHHSNTN